MLDDGSGSSQEDPQRAVAPKASAAAPKVAPKASASAPEAALDLDAAVAPKASAAAPKAAPTVQC